MKSFKDFGIQTEARGFVGDKIKIERILNREIAIHDYKIVPSKYDGKRLDMQISIGETMHVAWTSSTYLMETIEKIPKDGFPFRVMIKKDNEYYEFAEPLKK